MARKMTTHLTFAVTVQVPRGATIPMTREYIRTAVQQAAPKFFHSHELEYNKEFDDMRVHLTNKETSYA